MRIAVCEVAIKLAVIDQLSWSLNFYVCIQFVFMTKERCMMPTGSLHSPKITTGLVDTNLALKHRIETLTALVSALMEAVDRLRAELPPTKKYLPKHNSRAGSKQTLPTDVGIDFYREIELYEMELIKRALQRVRGSQRRAAELLGLNPTTLNAKLKHFANCGFDLTFFFRNKGDHLDG